MVEICIYVGVYRITGSILGGTSFPGWASDDDQTGQPDQSTFAALGMLNEAGTRRRRTERMQNRMRIRIQNYRSTYPPLGRFYSMPGNDVSFRDLNDGNGL